MKVLLFGDSGVGKTNFCSFFTNENFYKNHHSTPQETSHKFSFYSCGCKTHGPLVSAPVGFKEGDRIMIKNGHLCQPIRKYITLVEYPSSLKGDVALFFLSKESSLKEYEKAIDNWKNENGGPFIILF